MILALGKGFSQETPAQTAPASLASRWWTDSVEQRLAAAGENRAQLTRALENVPTGQRESLAFLLVNMPERDLRTLSADFLLEDVKLAMEARDQVPWGKAIPPDIFLNDVLPYVNASERRDAWRAELRARCEGWVAGCRTPGEAALRLNEKLFPAVNVRYSTARAKADQSPAESMASGLASCTGLTILLVDACRSVGVPARLVGIPDWSDGRGNHTWAEVWDGGKWHFLGAAEPDARGLDHAWFERDAALAQRDVPRHAIYAVSFRRTGLTFPIAWGPHSDKIDAENVTERYAPKGAEAQTASTVRLMVRVHEWPGGPRVVAKVRLEKAGDPTATREGETKGAGADTNDMLTFDLPRATSYALTVQGKEQTLRQDYATGGKVQETLDLALGAASQTGVPLTRPAPPELEPALREKLKTAVAAFYAAKPEEQARWEFAPELQGALQTRPTAVRRTVWEAFRAAPMHVALRADHEQKVARFREYVSPFTVRTVGTRPPGGWGLVIAMHGGGGAPKEVNDSQWQIMQRYYHDQPQAGGYLYVALRAPNDTWNGFYDDYVYPLVLNLLRQFAVCEEVDLNKVVLIGYSHGGYGAFAIGPKLPDRFAAIHSSAAAPTDGETSAKTLRNTPFSFWVGEFDQAYGRRERDEAFARTLLELKGPRRDIFPFDFELKTGRHHSDLPDRDRLSDLLPFTRNPVPRELTWEQTDGVVQDFYWLRDEHPAKRQELDATCRDNVLTVQTTRHPGAWSAFLDERLVDLEKPLTVEIDGQRSERKLQADLRVLCAEVDRRGDVDLAGSVQLDFPGTTGQ